jgi:hypothetical protein
LQFSRFAENSTGFQNDQKEVKRQKFIIMRQPRPSQPQEPCGYVPDPQYIALWKDPNSLPNKRLKFLKQFPLNRILKINELNLRDGNFELASPVRTDAPEEDQLEEENIIPVVAHVVRKLDGTGGITTNQLNDAFSTANGFLNTFNFFLQICDINYIDSDTIFDNSFASGDDDNGGNSNASFTVLDVENRNVDRCLNIYFVPKSNTSWAWRPNTNKKKQHILMLNSQTTNGTTLSHECGHWFDLLHTHQEGDELVDGSNCETAGDFVCDTPADPNLSGRVDSSCNYTGTVVDANGDSYNPDTRNLLSYAGTCRNRFSEGQIVRMKAALLGMDTDRGYTFLSCNGVDEKIKDYKWSQGWTTVQFYTINNQTYLFLLKETGSSGSSKNVHIHKMNNDGMVGTRIEDHKWTGGWTSAKFYTINNQTYLFLLKKKGLSGSNKNVHIHKMNNDGTVGTRIEDHKWTEGWTSTEFYTINNQTYLFLLKAKGVSASDKNVHIHKMNNNGTVGPKIKDYKWTGGWTSTEFYTINNQTYLFLLKKKGLSGSNKNVHIQKMNNDGTVGNRVTDYKWTEGWTSAKLYSINNQEFMFLLKAKGLSASNKNVHIHRLNDNSSVGKRVVGYKWTEGWTTSEFYEINDESYLFLLKEKGFSASNKNVHIHKMK